MTSVLPPPDDPPTWRPPRHVRWLLWISTGLLLVAYVAVSAPTLLRVPVSFRWPLASTPTPTRVPHVLYQFLVTAHSTQALRGGSVSATWTPVPAEGTSATDWDYVILLQTNLYGPFASAEELNQVARTPCPQNDVRVASDAKFVSASSREEYTTTLALPADLPAGQYLLEDIEIRPDGESCEGSTLQIT